MAQTSFRFRSVLPSSPCLSCIRKVQDGLLEKHPHQPERALTVLAKIRSGQPTDGRVQTEFHETVAYYECCKRYEPGYLGLIRSKPMLKRLCYHSYSMALQKVGGIATLTMYAAPIYKSLGRDSGHQASAINGIQATLQLFIVLVITFTVDRFERKTLLIVGFAIQSTALLILSSLTTSYPHNGNGSAAIAEIAMFLIVGLIYCFSNGPVTPAVASAIFQQNVRDKGEAILQSNPNYTKRIDLTIQCVQRSAFRFLTRVSAWMH